MKFIKLLGYVATLLCVFSPAALLAQSTVGTVYGNITDASDARLPDAQLTLKDTKTNLQQQAKSDKHGDYTFVAVKPGQYQVIVAADGFRTETKSEITVDANQNVDVSFKMALGDASEHVEVSGGASMVDTREAQIGETIDERRIEELPTINRDAYQLLQTVTGVTNFTSDALTGSRNGTNFTVNGFPATTSTFYLDGAQNNALENGGGNKPPNPSALQEARILTSNFDAEFGRSPGAVVSLITKSGADRYHGEVYEFLRNNALDAKPYFAPHGTIINFKQNQYGATAGGPLPHFAKTYFFLAFEHLELHQNQYLFPANYQAPTTLEAAGDFRNSTFSDHRHPA